MSHQSLATLCTTFAVVALIPALSVAQSAGAPPRTSWGDPDLQGVWNNATLTPFQRPEELGNQEFLSEEETANLEQEVLDRNERLLNAEARRTEAGGSIGAYNNFWMDTGTTSTGRTSLIIDPENGRFPDMTEAGQARAADSPTWTRI